MMPPADEAASPRFRRLDGALADLPLEEPMLLTELDGLLTGVLVCPAAIAAEEWLPIVWATRRTAFRLSRTRSTCSGSATR